MSSHACTTEQGDQHCEASSGSIRHSGRLGTLTMSHPSSQSLAVALTVSLPLSLALVSFCLVLCLTLCLTPLSCRSSASESPDSAPRELDSERRKVRNKEGKLRGWKGARAARHTHRARRAAAHHLAPGSLCDSGVWRGVPWVLSVLVGGLDNGSPIRGPSVRFPSAVRFPVRCDSAGECDAA